MADCDAIDRCGYFKTYGGLGPGMHQDFVSEYCHGQKMATCSRKKYRLEHGKPPVDHMLPDGSMLAE